MIRQLAAITIAASMCLAIAARAAEVNSCATNMTKEAGCALSEPVIVAVHHQTDVMRLDKHFTTVRISDPTVVDVQAMTDATFVLHGLDFGRTNVLFLDENNVTIKNVDVIVKSDPGQIVIFDRPKFGTNVYHCTPVGCEFSSQTTYELPATALPQPPSQGNRQ